MDPTAKKQALRMITYGLYVATARQGDQYAAGTVNWLSQASFEPPLVMVGLKKDSGLYALATQSRKFAVNIVGKTQKDLAVNFFKSARVEGSLIGGVAFETGVTGAPLLLNTPAYFECEVTDVIDRGDHAVVVGRVVGAGVRTHEEPLVMRDTGFFYGG